MVVNVADVKLMVAPYVLKTTEDAKVVRMVIKIVKTPDVMMAVFVMLIIIVLPLNQAMDGIFKEVNIKKNSK